MCGWPFLGLLAGTAQSSTGYLAVAMQGHHGRSSVDCLWLGVGRLGPSDNTICLCVVVGCLWQRLWGVGPALVERCGFAKQCLSVGF